MKRARLALGTAQLGLDYGVANRAGRPDPAAAERILQTALEFGIDYIDTAAAYGDAEAIIGRWRRRAESARVRIGTKAPKLPGGLAQGSLKSAIDEAVDASRKKLGVDKLDDLLVHSAANLHEYGQRLVDVLLQHREAGRVDRLGLSIYDADDAKLAIATPACAVVQFPFSVLNHALVADGAVDRLRAAGCVCLGRSALHQGLLTLGPEPGERAVPGSGTWLERFRMLCAAHDVDPLDAAIGYAVLSGADYVIVGVETAEQLVRLSKAFDRAMPDALAGEIRAAFDHVPEGIRDPRRWTPRDS